MIKKEKFKKALSLFLAFVLMLGIVMSTVSEITDLKCKKVLMDKK